MAALLLLSCSERFEQPVEKKAKIKVRVQEEAFTKSSYDSEIFDINLYVVDSDGYMICHKHMWNQQVMELDIYANDVYKVYAIVNADAALPAQSERYITGMSMYYSTDAGVMRHKHVLMTGVYGPCLISDGDEIVVPVTRTLSKILLKADFSGLNDDVDINVKKVQLKNIPNIISLFTGSAITLPGNAMSGVPVENPTREQLTEGISLYQFENMQGTYNPQNTDQKNKVLQEGSRKSKMCSYLQIEAEYASPTCRGDIAYRFYLGKDVTSNYDVVRNNIYATTVYFKGNGGVDENTWRVDVTELEDILPPEVSFESNAIGMYDLEERQLLFSNLQTREGELKVSSTDESVVEVLEWSEDGVKLKALAPGSATIIASVGGVSAECNVDVEKLRIVPDASSITLFNHFYEDIGYTIFPPHAASLQVGIAADDPSLSAGYSGVSNRLIPQYDRNTPFPVRKSVTLYVKGREDVSSRVEVVVNPMISMATNLTVNANMGNTATTRSLGLETSPRALPQMEWVPTDGISIYGTPPNTISVSNGNLVAQVPTSANGKYRLKCAVVGDDGYGEGNSQPADSYAYCDISIYETIFLVGVSKTQGKEKIGTSPDIWRYENEVVAKCMSHPGSLLFPEGEVNFLAPYIYNGVEYSDNHTEFIESHEFEFQEGETYEYSMGEGTFVYRGIPPQSYYQYFYLQPASSPYIEGSLPDNTPYIYLCPRDFASGFWQDEAPSWKKVFEYVYPN